MMKRCMTVVVALALCLAWVSPGAAADEKRLSGTVTRIDALTRIMTVTAKTGAKELHIAKNAVCVGFAAIGELKPGDKVVVTYVTADGQLKAQKIKKVSGTAANGPDPAD